MVEFWDDPDATAQRLVDGWILTGDVGSLDENGFLYLHDRKDDMIISGGFNIWPAELENVIAELPGVLEVAVFGIPHDRWGETPMAIVVSEKGVSLDPDYVIEACRVQLGSYKKPTQVEIQQGPLSRTPLGKISRRALRAPFWSRTDGQLGPV